MKDKIEKFKNLSYNDFKELANDDSLSKYEKIGFPDDYRKDKESFIFQDILEKFNISNASGKTILDIGIGCSDLASMIIEFTKNEKMSLVALDSEEMIKLLPDSNHITKISGYFPDETQDLISEYQEKVDYILCYSIFHCVFYNTCVFKFIDSAVSLLKPGGKLLLADLPNISKRKRFFSSPAGVMYHQNYTNTNTIPELNHLILEPTHIDDGVIFGVLQRYRNFGYETYLMPQGINLPMSNRREDILIVKN